MSLNAKTLTCRKAKLITNQVIHVVELFGAECRYLSDQGRPEVRRLRRRRHRRPHDLAGREMMKILQCAMHQHLLRALRHGGHAEVPS